MLVDVKKCELCVESLRSRILLFCVLIGLLVKQLYLPKFIDLPKPIREISCIGRRAAHYGQFELLIQDMQIR